MLLYLRDKTAPTIVHAATLRHKMQIKRAIPLSHSILTLCQAPGRVATGVPMFKSLAWLDHQRDLRGKQGWNPGLLLSMGSSISTDQQGWTQVCCSQWGPPYQQTNKDEPRSAALNGVPHINRPTRMNPGLLLSMGSPISTDQQGSTSYTSLQIEWQHNSSAWIRIGSTFEWVVFPTRRCFPSYCLYDSFQPIQPLCNYHLIQITLLCISCYTYSSTNDLRAGQIKNTQSCVQLLLFTCASRINLDCIKCHANSPNCPPPPPQKNAQVFFLHRVLLLLSFAAHNLEDDHSGT